MPANKSARYGASNNTSNAQKKTTGPKKGKISRFLALLTQRRFRETGK